MKLINFLLRHENRIIRIQRTIFVIFFVIEAVNVFLQKSDFLGLFILIIFLLLIQKAIPFSIKNNLEWLGKKYAIFCHNLVAILTGIITGALIIQFVVFSIVAYINATPFIFEFNNIAICLFARSFCLIVQCGKLFVD